MSRGLVFISGGGPFGCCRTVELLHDSFCVWYVQRVAAADGLVVEDAVQNVQCKRSRTSSLGRYRPADVAYDVRMGLLSLRPPRACVGRAAKRTKHD